MPAAAVMMSPALDVMVRTATERDRHHRDPFLSPAYGLRCSAAYRGPTQASHPRLDVLGAPKLGWPPMLIQVGDTECLQGDAEEMTASLRAAGVPVQLQVWPGQVHVFQGFGFLPEAREAIAVAGRFLAEHVDDGRCSEVTDAAI